MSEKERLFLAGHEAFVHKNLENITLKIHDTVRLYDLYIH